ncbi:MAG TPA: SRPBCC family protein [Xanthomonadales bacterium]|nr:SRPBCC family protein [Xanthomonadales bacterium]
MTLIVLANCLQVAQAEVTEVSDSSFTVSHSVTTAASPEQAWNAMTQDIAKWWIGAHSWSGDPANFYIRAELGGCFCERLPGMDGQADGGAEHLRIIYLKPGEMIRFDGSLGPFMDMPAQGRMSWVIAPAAEGAAGSTITFTYRVHGYMEGGFAGLAPVVDGVIGEQLQALNALLGQTNGD